VPTAVAAAPAQAQGRSMGRGSAGSQSHRPVGSSCAAQAAESGWTAAWGSGTGAGRDILVSVCLSGPGRAQRTWTKIVMHCLSVLIWKGVPQLLPMSNVILRAYIWDYLAFEALLPVLKHEVDAIKA
jgi:hypothetical protein